MDFAIETQPFERIDQIRRGEQANLPGGDSSDRLLNFIIDHPVS